MQYRIAKCSIVQPNIVSYGQMQYRIAKCNIVQPNVVSYSQMQYCIAKCSIVQPNVVSYSQMQYRIAKCSIVQPNVVSYSKIVPLYNYRFFPQISRLTAKRSFPSLQCGSDVSLCPPLFGFQKPFNSSVNDYAVHWLQITEHRWTGIHTGQPTLPKKMHIAINSVQCNVRVGTHL